MTRSLPVLLAAVASSAQAHPGHLVRASGHDHLVLLAGLSVIAALALPPILRAIRRRL